MNEQWTHSRRLVLQDGTSEGDVHRFATSLGWSLREEIPQDEDEGISRQVVWFDDPTIALHFFEDDITGFDYISVTGSDPDTVRTTSELVESQLNTWSLSELLEAFSSASDTEELAAAAIRAGLGAPLRFNQAFFDAIKGSLREARSRVREAAIWATSYTPWPAYRPLLEERVENDPDPELRNTAAAVLEEFDEAGIPLE